MNRLHYYMNTHPDDERNLANMQFGAILKSEGFDEDEELVSDDILEFDEGDDTTFREYGRVRDWFNVAPQMKNETCHHPYENS
jgi:hypothetical protein